MSSPLLVLGDAHASTPDRRRALFAAYRASAAEVALQCGDLLYYDLPVPTYFVGGNNEDFDVIEALRNGRVRSQGVENAHLLHSNVVEIAGRRVAGLTGNYAPSRFDRSRRDLGGERRRHFVKEDVDMACELSDIDIFLAHEAPHGLPVTEDYDVGNEHIDRILKATEPELCLVGHHHEHAETTFGPTRVVSLAPTWEAYYELNPESLALSRTNTPVA